MKYQKICNIYLLRIVLPFQKFYQPVGEVDVGGAGFRGGVFFEEVADFEVEMWEVGGAAVLVVVGIDAYRLSSF